jgi:hypothetical protein
MPKDYQVGDKVVITDETLEVMKSLSRSIKAFPSATFISLAESCKGLVGTVTRRFRPGFEFNVTFDRPWIRGDGETQEVTIMQMKDNWVTEVK